MKYTGKRHPFKGTYKVGYNSDGTINAVDLKVYSNGGLFRALDIIDIIGNWYDLSGPVLDRSLFHSDNAYYFPNFRTTGRICKTNTVSNTAFRGFGGPQGALMSEAVIQHVANELGIPAEKIREKHLYKHGQKTHFGMPVNVRFVDA